MDKSLENRIALGKFWINNQTRLFYNEIEVVTKGKQRGYVRLLYLHSNSEGLYLHQLTVRPEVIGDWYEG